MILAQMSSSFHPKLLHGDDENGGAFLPDVTDMVIELMSSSINSNLFDHVDQCPILCQLGIADMVSELIVVVVVYRFIFDNYGK